MHAEQDLLKVLDMQLSVNFLNMPNVWLLRMNLIVILCNCRGLEHTQAGYMVGAATTFKYSFDFHEDDVYMSSADCGW